MTEQSIDFESISNLFKALGHPVRLRIVVGLMSGHECDVTTMVENLKMPQSTISQHLSVLKNAKIIVFRKDGVRACYRVVNEHVQGFVKILQQ